jgi:hypothetical protein
MNTVRKTHQEKLRPTPAQERELERLLWRCRTLYNTALQGAKALGRLMPLLVCPPCDC